MTLTVPSARVPSRTEILAWLRQNDELALESLWAEADSLRAERVGDQVHLRGLIELSNHCARLCGYCGINAGNTAVSRYRMSDDEILACAHKAVAFGYGTVVLQGGEDWGLGTDRVTDLVRRISTETPLAVTLSLGERHDRELVAWKNAGADRYLLRFETSDPQLFARIHPSPDSRISDRPAFLRRLRELGFEVGSGVMVGIPGQTWDILANDLELMRALDLDMIGIGPWLPHPETTLVKDSWEFTAPAGEQVPNNELMTLKMVALARLMCPDANIPSTTALATINQSDGREHGLQRGANIVMPNLTPVEYRAKYEIYPGKACITESAEDCDACIKGRITRIARVVGTGRGDSPNQLKRMKTGAHA